VAHLPLDGQQIAVVGLEVGSEEVAKGVRVNPVCDVFATGAAGDGLDEPLDGDRGQAARVVVVGGKERVVTGGLIASEPLQAVEIPESKVACGDVGDVIGATEVDVAFAVAWTLGVQFDSALQVLVYGLMLFGLCSVGWDILRKISREYRRLKEADEVQAIDEVLQKQRKDSIL
jgi:hypothetical protein